MATRAKQNLARYRRRRNFARTPEPSGEKPLRLSQTKGLNFVIQKHDASRLHYDFRLELDGTLKSWAVPKGPSLDPSRKVLAVQVEDHPLDYQEFEGIIPAGQYGGGTVMVWDRGTWEPLDDPHAGLRQGHLRFALHGEKLHGNWSLIRMHGGSRAGHRRGADDGKNWLLIKSRDAFAGTGDILADAPESVKTHRTLEEIAEARDAHSQSRRPCKSVATKRPHLAHATNGHHPKADTMPVRIDPQLAVLADHPPEGDDWLHEMKFDGYRLLAFIRDGQVALHTRRAQDWTGRFEPLVPEFEKLAASTAIIDGEVVVLDAHGKSDFQLLQASLKKKQKSGLHYFAFDLLYLDGRDLRPLPLIQRKELLKQLLDSGRTLRLIAYSDHIQGRGQETIQKACALGSEGIISKRADAPYVSRRDPSWRKCKCTGGQEFVIAGYTLSDKRPGLRSLLLGVYGAEGLLYCGRVGTGFDEPARKDLLAELEKLNSKESALSLPPPRREATHARWVRPELVCEVHFEGWTRDGILRHPSFKGLRLDKPAAEVRREVSAKARILEKPPMTTHAPRAASKIQFQTKGRSAA